MKNSPIKQAKFVKKEFADYIQSTFRIKDKVYDELFRERLKQYDLFKGPYLSVYLPFKKGPTIRQLVAASRLEPEFIDAIPENVDRPLYLHQEEAINKVGAGKNIVVTTGTGSGKTECYLYPIINELIKESKAGIGFAGIRAILIFPMNALINDQVERLRNILSVFPQITFGFYNGETPEQIKRDNKNPGLANELMSREEMRANPPQILFTNYSMLDYILIRPNDEAIINSGSMTNWKYVVLDEAHSYRGTEAIEIGYLMRRLIGFAKKIPQFILTSATLGNGREDAEKVAEFATDLTSCTFLPEDVIFADRINLDKSNIKYKLPGRVYSELTKNICDSIFVKNIENEYTKSNDDFSIPKMLYLLLEHDENVFTLYELSKDIPSFDELLENFRKIEDISEDELSDLIELLAKAESDYGIQIFTLKYHSFVRAPEGAYITLKPHPALELKKTEQIDGFKAFIVSICEFCGTPYLTGRIRRGDKNLDYFQQVDSFEVDEENNDESARQVDYFILEDSLSEEEKEDIPDIAEREYVICSKCGSIHKKNDINAEKCLCGEEFENTIIQVESTNKVKKCLICNHREDNGAVVGFHIGKDSATALLTQNILESMETDERSIPQSSIGKTLLLNLDDEQQEPQTSNDLKQLLAFSDGRQQAAFFSMFFTHNEDRLERKAVVWRALDKSPSGVLSMSELFENVSSIYRQKAFHFQSDGEIRNESWFAILRDLLKIDGRNGSEEKGLYAFKIDVKKALHNFEDQFSEEDVVNLFKEKGFDLSFQQIDDLLNIGLDIFRTAPAIKYKNLDCEKEELDKNLPYRSSIMPIVLQAPLKSKATNKAARSFLPVRGENNKLIKYLKHVLGLDGDRAAKLAECLWQFGKHLNIIIPIFDGSDSFVIDVYSYSLYSYKQLSYFACQKCGNVTIYNLNGKCQSSDCDGELIPINPDLYFQGDYYRKEFMTKPMERIICQEHTAELRKDVARKYQKDFKDKKINVLSCTTTFEMGIDIGSLSTVLMRNVPPTPANYVQRAGRAGRKAGCSAMIYTFCSNMSHDYTFFNEPKKMIGGNIKPPYVVLENEKIAIRHFMATAIGLYFRSHPEAYKDVEAFLAHVTDLCEFIKQKPIVSELKDTIDNWIIGRKGHEIHFATDFLDMKWFTNMPDDENKLLLMNQDIKNEIDQLITSANNYEEDHEYRDYCRGRIKTLLHGDGNQDTSLISVLSYHNVIPRYGFPIDTIKLDMIDPYTGRVDQSHNPTRDMAIALSEYAPESELIMGKKKYTSHYINLPFSSTETRNPLKRIYYYYCPTCKRINISDVKFEPNHQCEYCSAVSSINGENYFMIPTFGFTATNQNRSNSVLKPVRTYANEIVYLGRGVPVDKEYEIKGMIKVTCCRNDELLIMNSHDFYYCPKCGYAEIHKQYGHPTYLSQTEHRNRNGSVCSNMELHHTGLGYIFITDVVKLELKRDLNIEEAYSTLYAILEGISKAFDIERNDINGTVIFGGHDSGKSTQFILFDSVPGGAGHVRRLLEISNLKAAFQEGLATVSHDCCDINTSCYNCLRNYNNQSKHKFLIRGAAKKQLEMLLKYFEA
ncbi:MAG: DEAD/DEAH box helicase [Bacilli bacterium]|jgi:hypothetical protein|nr:DEAD/DEAH box helicase [Bacilli bacterium]